MVENQEPKSGEPGHWRYNKDQQIKRGITSTDSMKKEQEKIQPKEEAEEIIKFEEGELFAMNKDEQVDLLNKLGVETIPRLEADRVKAILKAQE